MFTRCFITCHVKSQMLKGLNKYSYDIAEIDKVKNGITI